MNMKKTTSLVLEKMDYTIKHKIFSLPQKVQLVFWAALLSLPSLGVAATVPNPLKVKTVSAVFKAVFKMVAEIGAVALAIMIIYTGFLFVLAQGNETELQKAKSSLQWVLIGGALVLGAWALSEAIGTTIEGLK